MSDVSEFELIRMSEMARDWFRDHGCECACIAAPQDVVGLALVSGPHDADCRAMLCLESPEEFSKRR